VGSPSDALDNLGRDAWFNIDELPHVQHGYAVTRHSGHGTTADYVLAHVNTERGLWRDNFRLPTHRPERLLFASSFKSFVKPFPIG
jgi:hypothetical protein